MYPIVETYWVLYNPETEKYADYIRVVGRVSDIYYWKFNTRREARQEAKNSRGFTVRKVTISLS